MDASRRSLLASATLVIAAPSAAFARPASSADLRAVLARRNSLVARIDASEFTEADADRQSAIAAGLEDRIADAPVTSPADVGIKLAMLLKLDGEGCEIDQGWLMSVLHPCAAHLGAA